MTAHTPSPWEAVDSLTIRGPFAMGDHDKPGWLIASLPISMPEAERAANCALITAAPALLSIAQRWAALDGGAWHVARYQREREELLAHTSAAIADATGSTS